MLQHVIILKLKIAIPMDEENKYESERQHCLLLKAKIVSCMTNEVKAKISLKGYTPSEIATAYVLKNFNYLDDDYHVIDVHAINLKDETITPDYISIEYDESGTKIIDIIF